MFLYANSSTRFALQKVQSHLESSVVVAPEHASSGTQPWNVLSDEDKQSAAKFIENYADVHGLPQPAAPRGHNKPAPIYLPCHVTKILIHGQFLQSGGSMSYISFLRVWLSSCADIIIMRPLKDVCARCSDL